MTTMIDIVKQGFEGQVDLHQRRPDLWQLIFPVFHEDGDMIDLFVSPSPEHSGWVRIRDIGLTLMRLSYTFEINTPTKEKMLETLLAQNGVVEDQGEFYLDSPPEMIFQSVMQFVGLVQKVCNMRLWQKDTVKSLFYEELESFVFETLACFKPKKDIIPLNDYPVLEVDYMLITERKPFYLYGVSNQDKAKTAAIGLLEFQKAHMPFMGVIVYENMSNISKKSATYLTKNADKQFTSLDDFRSSGVQVLQRLAA